MNVNYNLISKSIILFLLLCYLIPSSKIFESSFDIEFVNL
jgi:hypothetical protein